MWSCRLVALCGALLSLLLLDRKTQMVRAICPDAEVCVKLCRIRVVDQAAVLWMIVFVDRAICSGTAHTAVMPSLNAVRFNRNRQTSMTGAALADAEKAADTDILIHVRDSRYLRLFFFLSMNRPFFRVVSRQSTINHLSEQRFRTSGSLICYSLDYVMLSLSARHFPFVHDFSQHA